MSLASAKAWKAANPERARANRRRCYEQNRAREIQRAAEWCRVNPEAMKAFRLRKAPKVRDASAVKKAGRTGIAVMFRPSDVRADYGNRCWACGSTDRVGIDHIHPLSRGGSNFAFNIRLLCASCNARKYNRLDHEVSDAEFRARLLMGFELPASAAFTETDLEGAEEALPL